jgi:hypothetical protein
MIEKFITGKNVCNIRTRPVTPPPVSPLGIITDIVAQAPMAQPAHKINASKLRSFISFFQFFFLLLFSVIYGLNPP